MSKSTKPLILTGAYYVRSNFVSKSHVQSALKATGKTILNRPPRDDNDVLLVTGKVLGKRNKTQLHAVAEARGFDVEDLDNLVTPRFVTALAKSLRSASKLLPSERKLLQELASKKTKAA